MTIRGLSAVATTGSSDNAGGVVDSGDLHCGLRFVSADEIKAYTPSEPPWILSGYLAPGNITLLGGKPKAGKSRLALDLTSAIVNRAPSFIGKPVDGGPVVYVSEEGAATLAHKLPDSPDVRILIRENAWPKPDWATLIAAAVEEAHRIGAVPLIVDTVPYWSGLPPEREKDSGAVLQIMEACVYAARGGLAPLLLAHTRKGGGEDGESIRGSSAFAGSADIILELERVPDAPRQRALLALSRYPQTPGTLVAELDQDGAWHAVSEDADRSDTRTTAARQRDVADRDAILAALNDGSPLTRADLEDATGAPARQWHTTLEALLKDGAINKTGAGKKGDPYRFQILRKHSAQAAAHNGAETDAAPILLSALPRRGAETESSPAPKPNGGLGAECAPDGHGWTEDELQALVDQDGRV